MPNLQLLLKIKLRAARAAQRRSGPSRQGLSLARSTAPAPEGPRASSPAPGDEPTSQRAPAPSAAHLPASSWGQRTRSSGASARPGRRQAAHWNKAAPCLLFGLFCAPKPCWSRAAPTGSRMERALLGEAPQSPAPTVPKGPQRCSGEHPTERPRSARLTRPLPSHRQLHGAGMGSRI